MGDYSPSRFYVSYDVVYLPFLVDMVPMFGWDVPSRVDPLLFAMFLFYTDFVVFLLT